MKKLVKVEEVEGEGLVGLMGEVITVYCLNYIYSGKLVGVNDTCIKLDYAYIVYDTGPHTDKNFKDAQLIGDGQYVQTQAIESFRKR